MVSTRAKPSGTVRHLAHEAARPLPRMDQPLLAQPFQRLAQDRARHAELVGERLLGRQLLVRRIVAVRDPAVEQVIDPVGEPRPGARRLAAGRPFVLIRPVLHRCLSAGPRRRDDRDERILAAEAA